MENEIIMSQKKRRNEPHFKHWRPGQKEIKDGTVMNALKATKEKYREYECTKCHCIFECKDECFEHAKESKHYSFKLRGTQLVLNYV